MLHLFLADLWIAKLSSDSVMAILALVAMLGIIIGLGVLGGRLAWHWHGRREAKRTVDLQAALQRFSYTLVGKSPVDQSFLAGFLIGRNRKSPQIINHFVAQPRPDETVHLLDYGSLELTGRYHVFIWQTLAVIAHPLLQLPSFLLASQKFGTVVVLGKDAPDIEIEGHCIFQKSFRLRGPDEPAVRALFVPSVISELERHPHVTIEGHGSHLVLYRRRTRVKAAKITEFQEEMRKLAQLFLGAD